MLANTAIEKQFWAEGSGLLPVRLSPVSDKEQYILLDGGLYDFCLDLNGEEDNSASYYSAAWSSDVKNYISVCKDNAIVFNWSKQSCEKVKLSLVQEKFQSFLKILNANSYRTSDDVTPFILSLFAQLRNLTREQQEPTVALNLLFKLLVTLEEDNLSPETCNTWKIEDVDLPNGFESVRESLHEGVRRITPNLDYILRHGSGPLFETAHREALYFDSQYNLFGGISSNLGYAKLRKYSGVHYTPRYLVRSIVENCLKGINLNKPCLTILDPACGSGAFLQEVLKQLREKVNPDDIQIVLKGWDVSSMAVQTAQFLLSYENRKMWKGRIRLDVRQQDSLDVDWEQNDIILMNPPFISSELIKEEATKEKVNAVLADLKMKKRPNMAAAFLYKAIHSLSDNGKLGVVLPSSILQQEQYDTMRQLIRETASVDAVAHLGSYVFGEALTDTGFIVAQKQADNQQIPLNIWCSNNAQSAFDAMKGWRKMGYEQATEKIENNYNIYTPLHFPTVRNSWKVLSKDNDRFLREMELRQQNGSLKTLSAVFKASQGILKGNRDVFELDLEEYGQVPDNEKHFFRPLASSKTIMPGYVMIKRYIWYPYSKDGLMIKTEDDFRQYPWSYQWLSPHKQALLNRSENRNWWELTRARADRFEEKEPFLCSKRFGGAHSFALAPAGCVVTEGNSYQFLKTDYWNEDVYFYLAFFSSSLFQRLLSIYARPLMSGYDLGNAQIKDIPIVNVMQPGIRESSAYRELVQLGMKYSEGFSALRDSFDQYIMEFYR